MKLCLGTVQFGQDYGIRNQKQPSVEKAVEMLDYAVHNGIDHLDTANAYGTAEDVMGVFLKKTDIPRDKLFISAKLRPNILDGISPDKYYDVAKENLELSFKRMGTDYLDAYMCHSARYVFNDEILDVILRLKQEGYVRHCGVSVYEVDEAKRCIESDKTDFTQFPFSIFDQRMLAGGVFDMPQKHKTEIHTRSAFIQGLILMKENEVPPFLSKAKPIVAKIDSLCAGYGISRIALAIGFVKRQKAISHLVFGVDNIEQLKEDIALFEQDLPQEVIDAVGKEFKGLDTDIVMPSLWKK